MNNGRKEIITDLIPTGNVSYDKKIIPVILENALGIHQNNVADYKVLEDYYYNKTDIQYKVKVQQPDINNKIGVPYANLAVITINSYCFSNPLSRNSRSSDESVTQKVKELNDALDDDDYDSKTAQVEQNSGIYGIGYKFIRPANAEELKRGIWFKTVGDLDPKSTFCVRSNGIERKRVLACTYFTKKVYDKSVKNFKIVTVYNVYTNYHYWIFVKDDEGVYKVEKQLLDGKQVDAYPLIYNKIPIIEYPRKQDKTNDFEIAKDLIDAINNLTSSRVDDVQQAVDYILLLRDISTETKEDIEKIMAGIRNGLMSFKSIQDVTVQPDIKVLDTRINQGEVQTLNDYLCNKLEEALNIPNREIRGSSGDTGLAVESRAGYRSLENIAGLITLCAKRAENEALDVILAICDKFENCPFKGLTISDIEIKANRNKVENITTAANAYSTMKAAGMNDESALTFSGIAPDPIGTATKNKKAKEKEEARSIELERIRQRITQENTNSTDENN